MRRSFVSCKEQREQVVDELFRVVILLKNSRVHRVSILRALEKLLKGTTKDVNVLLNSAVLGSNVKFVENLEEHLLQ